MSSVPPFRQASTVWSITSSSSRVPRTHSAPIQRKNQVSSTLISNSSFLAKTTIRRPQNRVMTTNTGSMAETWFGAMMQPLVRTFFRFSRPMHSTRNPMWNTIHASGSKI